MQFKIVWFTGLSGSGKSTLANNISKILKTNSFKVKVVDGDSFRRKKYNSTFTKKSIINNNIKIINHVKKISKKYDYVLVSVISPLLKTRLKAKKVFKRNYFEIFVNCPLKELKLRDTKGLYKKADQKIIKNLIGYNSEVKYEKSDYKVININTKKLSINNSVKKIIKKIT